MSKLSRIVVAVVCVACMFSLPAIAQGGATPGAVYTLSNSAAGNSVVVFDRQPDGTLTAAGAVATGGNGAGGPLASQSSLAFSDDHRWLLASNAGSDTVSVLSVSNGRPTLVGSFDSGGHFPYSITVHGRLVYVLNAGNAGGAASNVAGFALDESGNLTPLGSYGLSAAFVDPAQVAFRPDGKVLMVTERGTNLISAFPVQSDGTLGARVTSASAGLWPYGFGFGIKNQVFVSEAVLMAPGASSVSSYLVHDDGSLTTVSAASPTHQTAACWVAVTPGGRYTYTTDALSKAISGYSIDRNGALTLLNADGVTATTPVGFDVDTATSNDGRFLYVLQILNTGITGYRIGPDGSLSTVGSVTLAGFPSGLVVQ